MCRCQETLIIFTKTNGEIYFVACFRIFQWHAYTLYCTEIWPRLLYYDFNTVILYQNCTKAVCLSVAFHGRLFQILMFNSSPQLKMIFTIFELQKLNNTHELNFKDWCMREEFHLFPPDFLCINKYVTHALNNKYW